MGGEWAHSPAPRMATRSVCVATLLPVLLGMVARLAEADPKIVIAAGGRRAGSTELYNIARLVSLTNDPNTIAGWWSDSVGGGDMPLGQQLGFWKGASSIVMKAHSVKEDFLEYADVVMLSHRAVKDQLCSFALIFTGQNMLPNPANQTAVDEACGRWSLTCRIMSNNQKKNYQVTASAVRDIRVIDIDFEHLVNPDLLNETITAVAEAMDVSLSDYDLDRIRRDLDKIEVMQKKDDSIGPHHPLTLMHEGHVHTEEDKRQCEPFYQCLEGTTTCTDFINRGGRNEPEYDATPQWSSPSWR